MRELTIEEIRELANQPGVRKTAVENFLISMGNNRMIAFYNLALDAKLYKWNTATVLAIIKGIRLASREVKDEMSKM